MCFHLSGKGGGLALSETRGGLGNTAALQTLTVRVGSEEKTGAKVVALDEIDPPVMTPPPKHLQHPHSSIRIASASHRFRQTQIDLYSTRRFELPLLILQVSLAATRFLLWVVNL
jgi:hypothetical protein